MADRLTQLQDSLDDFLIDCYASLNYIDHHHPYADIPNQPSQAPPTVTGFDPSPSPRRANGDPQEQQNEEADRDPEPSDKPHSPEEFTACLRELAQALVLKEQQMEYLIASLPGIGNSERDQEKRMRELQEELRVVERLRAEKEGERERLVEGLGNVVVGVRRVP